MFARNDLDEPIACDKRPAVSIYMPPHPAGREVRQDAIRLRNLLNRAPKRLAEQVVDRTQLPPTGPPAAILWY